MLKPTRLLVSFLVLLVFCLGVVAQTGTSNITGSVRDTNGSVVPGATVTARNEATGVTSTQTTTESGLYSFASLPVGNYTVTIEKQGFKTLQKKNNALQLKGKNTTIQTKGDIIVNSKHKRAVKVDKKGQIIADQLIVSGGIDRKSKNSLSMKGIRFWTMK